jgi:hypothetical protein
LFIEVRGEASFPERLAAEAVIARLLAENHRLFLQSEELQEQNGQLQEEKGHLPVHNGILCERITDLQVTQKTRASHRLARATGAWVKGGANS